MEATQASKLLGRSNGDYIRQEDRQPLQKRRRVSPPAEPARFTDSAAQPQTVSTSFEEANDSDECHTPEREIDAAERLSAPSSRRSSISASRRGRSYSRSTDDTSFDVAEAASDARATADITTSRDIKLSLPRLDPPTSGQRWAVEAEDALLRYVASDDVLRGWATVVTSDGLMASLQHFCDATQGPKLANLYKKLMRWRNTFRAFYKGLSPAGQRTGTEAWTDKADLASLASAETKPVNRWIRLWHDTIWIPFHHPAAAAVGASSAASLVPEVVLGAAATASTQKGKRKLVLVNRSSHSVPSGATSLPAALVASPLSGGVGEISAALSLASSVPSAASNAQLPMSRSVSSQSEPDLLAQLKEQALQISFLQGQSELQSELLERQAQTADRQTAMIENMQQQLESLHALMARERK